MRNRVSISTGALPKAMGKLYYDFSAALSMMERVWDSGVVDGFEFVCLDEWDQRWPPMEIDLRREYRVANWERSPKHSEKEIGGILSKSGVPILTLHSRFDIGPRLCSDSRQDIQRGKRLIHESLDLSQQLNCPVCVFHLWDTWGEMFDPRAIKETFEGIASQYPAVKASVENIPVSLPGYTPIRLVEDYDNVTADTGWAALYDELEEFQRLTERIVNVHLAGRLKGNRWELCAPGHPEVAASFDFYKTLEAIRTSWGYQGLLTIEPKSLVQCSLDDLLGAIVTVNGAGR